MSAFASSRTLIIGIGNPLRSDDAAGRVLAERAASLFPHRYTALVVHQLTPDLAADIANADAVIFADASVNPAEAPRLVPVRAGQVGERPSMTHGATPEFLVSLAAFCFGQDVPSWTLEIPGSQFRHGTQLSEGAEHQVQQALGLLEEMAAPEPRSRGV